MATPEYIVIDKVEDATTQDSKPYKLVTAKDGEQYKFKIGRGECIRNKWHLLEEGKALKLKWEQFKGYDFIADFELVENVFEQEAVAKTQERGVDTRNKSMALSYAKDLIVAGKIDISEIAEYAEMFYLYMVGDLTVDNPRVINLLGGKRNESKTPETKLSGKPNGAEEANKPETKPVSGEEAGEGDRREFKTLGEFFTAVNKELGLNRTDTLQKLGVSSPTQVGDLSEAWEKLTEGG